MTKENMLALQLTIKSAMTNLTSNTIDKKRAFFWLVVSVGILDFLSHVSSLAFYLVFGKNDRPFLKII